MCGRNWPKTSFHHNKVPGGKVVEERDVETGPSSHPRYLPQEMNNY